MPSGFPWPLWVDWQCRLVAVLLVATLLGYLWGNYDAVLTKLRLAEHRPKNLNHRSRWWWRFGAAAALSYASSGWHPLTPLVWLVVLCQLYLVFDPCYALARGFDFFYLSASSNRSDVRWGRWLGPDPGRKVFWIEAAVLGLALAALELLLCYFPPWTP
jgi:hypothetical protein